MIQPLHFWVDSFVVIVCVLPCYFTTKKGLFPKDAPSTPASPSVHERGGSFFTSTAHTKAAALSSGDGAAMRHALFHLESAGGPAADRRQILQVLEMARRPSEGEKKDRWLSRV